MDADARGYEEFKRQESEIMTEATRVGDINRSIRLIEKQEVVEDSKPINSRLPSNVRKGTNMMQQQQDESPIMAHRSSRTETVRQDVRKLKTATLNRMGKMFKQRSQTPGANKSGLNNSMDGAEMNANYGEDPSQKEKSNSLGRMLKRVDKDGSPKKLFHPRAGSLSRILRRHSHNESNDEKKDTDENAPGIFSRMFNQLRGRPLSGSSVKGNATTGRKMSTLPPKVPPSGKPSNCPPSGAVSSSPKQTPESLQKLVNLEYSI
ncbi:uncharacterized protein LOC143214464 [Lasioglossum baleicum]|uniref:uncharacterized protein LOC143214464 n=1 Tax=Lasioglossum baleicum TaxID=434251 RepID=UPI003FCCA7B4